MKKHRHARQIGLTSKKKIKTKGNPRYMGGTDSNKGKKKKTWFEFGCWECGNKFKTSPGAYPPCPHCKTKPPRW